ncbi:biopolymer transporter ExbD [Halanaerocella petrolearia]
MGYKIDKPDPAINLAPMIDVVFLLLIFFIVTSTLNIREVKKEIQLPSTETVQQKEKTKLSISLTQKGQVYVKDKRVAWTDIKRHLTEELKKNSQNQITIFADKKVSFEQVVKLMDIAKELQINNLSFALYKE